VFAQYWQWLHCALPAGFSLHWLPNRLAAGSLGYEAVDAQTWAEWGEWVVPAPPLPLAAALNVPSKCAGWLAVYPTLLLRCCHVLHACCRR
jgi:hypothetical protein